MLVGLSSFPAHQSSELLQNPKTVYGFVIPLPQGEDTTSETFERNTICNLINDMLRENISVFWIQENTTGILRPFSHSTMTVQQHTILKGSFLLLFSGETEQDSKLISICTNYNTTSEIEEQNQQIPVYLLCEPLYVPVRQLQEVRIAQHLGKATRYSWPCYLQIAEASGFFTMEFLLDEETDQLLEKPFTVFMWPYHPHLGTSLEVVTTMTNQNLLDTVREFVRNGGGYIGSCYGAIVTSMGFVRPSAFPSLYRVNHPELPAFLPSFTFSLTDTLMAQRISVLKNLYIATTHLQNTSHPLTFGINQTMPEFFSGPWFVWHGSHTEQISEFVALESESLQLNPVAIQRILQSPDWMSSSFGEGDIILFASHPEFVINISLLMDRFHWQGDPYYGMRVIQNALFTVTSKPIDSELFYSGYNQSFVFTTKNSTQMMPMIPSSKFIQCSPLYFQLQNISNLLSEISHEINTTKESGSDAIPDEYMTYLVYASHFTTIYQNHIKKTQRILPYLESILHMIRSENMTTTSTYNDYQQNITSRLNQSSILLYKTRTRLEQIQKYFQNIHLFIPGKLVLIYHLRTLLEQYETGLKTIPQTYFETIKLLRHLWYAYETNHALSL